MHTHLTALSPENLHLVHTVARTGSMAAAARELGLVPSALTYRVRHMEEALDVLLFDRRSRRAQLTPAGAELLHAGEHLLQELDAVAQRVKRVATGWEPQFTVAADGIVSLSTLLDLCEAFYASGAPTRLRLRAETLSGTLEVLKTGQADLALGVSQNSSPAASVQLRPLGEVPFVFVVAPHHPLARHPGPIPSDTLQTHRIVAVADSTQRGNGVTVGLLPGQDVLTVPTLHDKLQAQLRGLGCGFLPLPMVQHHLQTGQLVAQDLAQPPRVIQTAYAWRTGTQTPGSHATPPGKALEWWLAQLDSPTTRHSLLHRHSP